jgi:hypothetical protein
VHQCRTITITAVPTVAHRSTKSVASLALHTSDAAYIKRAKIQHNLFSLVHSRPSTLCIAQSILHNQMEAMKNQKIYEPKCCEEAFLLLLFTHTHAHRQQHSSIVFSHMPNKISIKSLFYEFPSHSHVPWHSFSVCRLVWSVCTRFFSFIFISIWGSK